MAAADELKQAGGALATWHEARAWARKGPGQLSLAAAERVGPMRIVLHTIFEQRGVRYESKPASGPPRKEGTRPDPWDTPLKHAPDAPVGAELSRPLEGVVVHMHCGVCRSTGGVTCSACGGDGTQRSGNQTVTCGSCGGSGEVICDSCSGSGGLLGSPTVWSRIDEHSRARIVDDDKLPMDVFLHLQEVPEGGDLTYQHEAPRIHDLPTTGTYRDAGGPTELTEAVRELAESPGMPEDAKIVRQSIEIRCMPAWRLELPGGKQLWIYGQPLQVAPKGALDSATMRALRIAPLVVAALAAAAAAWHFLM